jgi:hypothetical protein
VILPKDCTPEVKLILNEFYYWYENPSYTNAWEIVKNAEKIGIDLKPYDRLIHAAKQIH